MAKKIKRNLDIIIAIGVGLALVMVAMIGIHEKVAPVDYVSAATTSVITVSATVGQTIELNVSTTAMVFGTLSSGSVNATTNDFSIKTNAANGYTLTIKDLGDTVLGGLLGTTTEHLIISTTTSPLTAGTEGYGAQGTTTTGGMSIYSPYNVVGDSVGQLATTSQNFASSSTATAFDQGTLTLKATIHATSTPADTYYDTITLTLTGSF